MQWNLTKKSLAPLWVLEYSHTVWYPPPRGPPFPTVQSGEAIFYSKPSLVRRIGSNSHLLRGRIQEVRVSALSPKESVVHQRVKSRTGGGGRGGIGGSKGLTALCDCFCFGLCPQTDKATPRDPNLHSSFACIWLYVVFPYWLTYRNPISCLVPNIIMLYPIDIS